MFYRNSIDKTIYAAIDSSWERLVLAILATSVISLMANGYAYFNYYPIHDQINYVYGGWCNWQISLGRFLMPLYMMIRGDIAMPLVTGILTCVYLGVSVFLITKILNQHTKAEVCLTAGFLSANIYMTYVNVAHQYYMDAFMFAFMLACLGFYIINSKMNFVGFLISILLYYISFGIYPAFISVILLLFVLCIVQELIDVDEYNRVIFSKFFVHVGTIAAAGVLYMLSSRLSLSIMHLQPSQTTNSIFSISNYTLSSIIGNIVAQYKQFIKEFFYGRDYIGVIAGVMTTGLSAACIITFFNAYWVKKKKWVIAAIIVLVAILPLFMRLINVFTMNNKYQTLFAQYLTLPIMIWTIYKSSLELRARGQKSIIAPGCAIVLSVVILTVNVRFSNGAYTVQRNLYDRAIYCTERIIEDLDELNYNGEKVAILGTVRLNDPYKDEISKRVSLMDIHSRTGITYAQLLWSYASYYGYRLNWDSSYANVIKNYPEVKAMPCYPSDGYIQQVDEYFVIKMSG